VLRHKPVTGASFSSYPPLAVRSGPYGSAVEKDRLSFTLHHDGPAVFRLSALPLRDQCIATGRILDQAEHRILGIRRLVGKIDARIEMPEHAAHEQADDDMRSLQAVARAGHPAGLDGAEAEPP